MFRSPCRNNGGFSLMEAVFASFLLITSILISVLVFDTSLQTEANNEQRTTAALVAESALDEIRSSANENFEALKTNYDDKTWTLPAYRGFEIKSRVDAFPLAIPCSELEVQYEGSTGFPEPEPRFMQDSVWKCEVEVSWSRGTAEGLKMVQYMANLNPVANFRVEITPRGGTVIDDATTGTFPVGKDQYIEFGATAIADGQTVSDVQFTWYVEPLNGFGSVYRVSREGDRCWYKNVYKNYNGQEKHAPGLCDLVVRAVYQGVEATRKVRIQNG